MPQTLRTRVLMAALLGAAMLLAAHSGWQHRIAHARGKPAESLGAVYAHSCAAFDAATLADGLPSVSVAARGNAHCGHWPPPARPVSHLAAAARLFDARGPPCLPGLSRHT